MSDHPEPESPEAFIQAVFSRAWEVFLADAILFVLGAVVVTIGGVFTCGLLIAPLTVGYIQLTDKRLRGEPATFTDVFSGFSSIIPALITTFLVFVGVTIGTMMCVIPGVLIACFTCYALHLIALDQAGIGEALSGSIDLVKAHFIKVVLLLVVSSVLTFLGTLIVVGWLVTAPLSLVVMTVGYHRLMAKPEALVV